MFPACKKGMNRDINDVCVPNRTKVVLLPEDEDEEHLYGKEATVVFENDLKKLEEMNEAVSKREREEAVKEAKR